MSAHVRPERPEDLGAIRAVNARAFARDAEADLVDALRAAGVALASLVAEQAGVVVGHILFSPVTLETAAGEVAAVGLAPMAVLPALQRRGIGSQLVQEGLEVIRRQGHASVVVLGHPSYYPRFGFVPASRFGIRWELDCPDEAFFALELVPGALAGKRGVVRFRPEFARV